MAAVNWNSYRSGEKVIALFDVDTWRENAVFCRTGRHSISGIQRRCGGKILADKFLDGECRSPAELIRIPVKAAGEALYHLEGGSENDKELLYEAERQYLFFQKGGAAHLYMLTDPNIMSMVFAESSQM